jgi:sugar transferase (PEP-CTERM/EpsH1 system associated)
MNNREKKINVMHVLPSLEIGGMENGVVNLVNGLNRSIYKPLICCLEREGKFRKRLKDDVKIYNLKQKAGLRYQLPIALMNIFKNEEINIVHTHNFYTCLYGVIAAYMAKVPVIIHGEHGLVLQDKYRRKIVVKYLTNFADTIVSVSNDLKRKIVRDVGIKKNKIVLIENGIDIGKYDSRLSRADFYSIPGIKKGDIVIGSVGRMIPVKDYKTLIFAFEKAVKRISKLKLLLVGDGPSKEELEILSEDLGVEDKFAGTRNDVNKLYTRMDIFALSSLSEGMSNVVLEAMASKLPVLATEVGSNNELIDNGKTGYLVPVASPDELAKKICLLSSDLKNARKMGKAGYERIKARYSLAVMITKYEKLYSKWLKKKGVY